MALRDVLLLCVLLFIIPLQYYLTVIYSSNSMEKQMTARRFIRKFQNYGNSMSKLPQYFSIAAFTKYKNWILLKLEIWKYFIFSNELSRRYFNVMEKRSLAIEVSNYRNLTENNERKYIKDQLYLVGDVVMVKEEVRKEKIQRYRGVIVGYGDKPKKLKESFKGIWYLILVDSRDKKLDELNSNC
ncbi:hypothetical protein SNEBB_003515 [Seison nebaliae]|nr:hypothetical protein SNEBB_003515 [Seison nebaliae]